MQLNKRIVFIAVVVLLATSIEAKKKKHKSSESSKSKTKTKWSTSSYNDESVSKSIVATEEHGYYVKRTFLPLNGSSAAATLASPPYLAIPIAWFTCDGDCAKGNSVAINGETNAIKDGFLCDDDCMEPYDPICGKTPREVAVFYNKCKLNVAKCRTHGLWTDLAYDECQKTYSKEVQYAERKFKSSPYFTETAMALVENTKPEDDKMEASALEALHEVSDRIEKAEANMETEGSGSIAESSTVKIATTHKKDKFLK